MYSHYYFENFQVICDNLKMNFVTDSYNIIDDDYLMDFSGLTQSNNPVKECSSSSDDDILYLDHAEGNSSQFVVHV